MAVFLAWTAVLSVLLPVPIHAEEPEGLVLYYTFDTEEEKITDLSGNGNNAFIRGEPKWVAGKMGKALKFEAKGEHLKVLHSDSLNPDEMTIALWVNWSGENEPCRIIAKYQYLTGGYRLEIQGGGTNFLIHDKVANEHSYVANLKPIPNEWTHLAVTFDGEKQSGFVNGEIGNLDTPWNAWDGPIGHTKAPLKMGAFQENSVFTGILDEVAIYNRALTEQEILEVMQKGHTISRAVHSMNKLGDAWGHLKQRRDRSNRSNR
jgi:hypothetical protein